MRQHCRTTRIVANPKKLHRIHFGLTMAFSQEAMKNVLHKTRISSTIIMTWMIAERGFEAILSLDLEVWRFGFMFSKIVFLNSPSQFQNEFQCFDGSVAVIFLLVFREVGVVDETRTLFEGVVTHRAIGPAVIDAPNSPDVMHVAGHLLCKLL